MNTNIKVLLQIFNGAVWDGNLIAKMNRDVLVKYKLVTKCVGGWNIITTKGIKYLHELGFIQS